MVWFQVCAAIVLLLSPIGLTSASRPASMTAASGSGPQAMNFTVEGKITRHEPKRLTVSAQQNMIFRVRYADSTTIKRQDGTAGTPQDLRLGIRIRVAGELTESGEIVASRIELL